MTHPVKVPKDARRVPPANELTKAQREETWEWIVGQGFSWHIPDDSPLWFANGHMYAHRLNIRYPDRGGTNRARGYELTPGRLDFATRLVGYPVRGLPPYLADKEDE